VNILLFPLTGAFFVIFLAVFAIKIWALVDALTRRDAAFPAAGKQTKTLWIVILVLALFSGFLGFLSILGLVAAIVYLVDVRPAVKVIPRGGSSQMGPYGPW
jgi:nitrate/nitrite transporter NarK